MSYYLIHLTLYVHYAIKAACLELEKSVIQCTKQFIYTRKRVGAKAFFLQRFVLTIYVQYAIM